jgi:hypothetical protein
VIEKKELMRCFCVEEEEEENGVKLLIAKAEETAENEKDRSKG